LQMAVSILATGFCVLAGVLSLGAAPDVTRSWFTPLVIPDNYTQQVSFEATITENPASVAFEYYGVDRPMFDDGSNGDLVAGDGTWTILFQPRDIFSKLTPARVHRPFIGFCKPAGGARYNTFAEVWDSSIGLAPVHRIDASAQQTDYIVNLVATRSQLLSFNPALWANRFYALQGDKFDFLNFVLAPGRRSNRYHSSVRNDVQGIGTSIFNITSQYGSAGRLKGCNVFPIPSFFDAGEPAFNHEMGHQWINFLQGTPFASGVPHWPKGDIAINVMGFSISGGAGGTYGHTFTPNGQGGYLVGQPNPTNISTFNSMELYLMGLVPPSAVGTFFVLTNQSQNLTAGQVLQPSEITTVTVSDVIAARGPRVPDSTVSQKTFRCATVVLSEQLLDTYALSFYDWFARRAEAKQPVSYASGFATGISNPFFVATGGRAVMFSKIQDDRPTISLRRLGNGDVQLNFRAKLGIRYQFQSSGDSMAWLDNGPSVAAPLTNPTGDVDMSVLRTPMAGSLRGFYRLGVSY